jgi:deazaflavin-dependent oxidoreductase (nitroreductase family)
VFRAYVRMTGTTRPAIWFARRVLWKLDPMLLRLTGGRLSLAPAIPNGLLDTIGARTGEVRRHAVIYFHDGHKVTIVASKFGDPEHPAWFHNAVAHPDVVFAGRPYRAQVVDDEAELARLWPLAEGFFPPYAFYRARAARTGRTIPMLQLTPS